MSEENDNPGAMSRLLARIDERTANLIRDVAEVKSALNANYVTRQEFAPIKAIVYGLVGIILVSVVGALLFLVVKK